MLNYILAVLVLSLLWMPTLIYELMHTDFFLPAIPGLFFFFFNKQNGHLAPVTKNAD